MLAVESRSFHNSSKTKSSTSAFTSSDSQEFQLPKEVVQKYSVEYVGNAQIEDLIQKKIVEDARDPEEAFYFIDMGKVIAKYKQWIQNLPRVKPFFAIKCNPNVAIIRTLASYGVNFDCASQSEIQQILGCGVAPNRIIYANPTKMKSHIRYAKAMGVELMTFDNKDELIKCAELYPEAKLVLRIITDDSSSVCKFSTKFGAPLDVCEELISTAKDLNLNLVGISFHVGSGCMSVASFESAITNAARIFKLAENYGYQFNLLDLGGGWPGNDSESSITFNEIAASIRPLLDALFDESVEIIAEPGRYFVAESHTLAVNVFAKRCMISESGERKFLYYINDGVYQSFNCIFFDHNSPKPIVLSPGDRSDLFRSTIFGPTCDSMDCIGKDILLPELEVGEWIYFRDMGAYTVAAASPFNGFKSCPSTYYIESDVQ
jgi:ornithine decarboxylase